MQQEYPLSWPVGWRRSNSPQRSDFGTHSIAKCVNEITRQLKLIGARNVVISSNLVLRADGLPRSGQAQPVDKGCAVYFKIGKDDRVLACDKWARVEDNMWAIAKHIDALRGQQRWGVGTVEQAFTGYAALPPAQPTKTWWRVLGFEKDISRHVGWDARTKEDFINARWRILAAQHHPDVGGSDAKMAEINVARDQGLEAIGAK